jgi:hypothetical protein
MRSIIMLSRLSFSKACTGCLKSYFMGHGNVTMLLYMVLAHVSDGWGLRGGGGRSKIQAPS